MFKKLNKKGFTLAELLIVVAIIGVLVAISIPIFTSQLEKARDAADAANLRAAYAEASAKVLEGENDVTSDPVTIKGTKAGFTGVDNIAGISTTTDTVLKAAVKGQEITVTVHADGSAPTFAVK
jgi:prepilin-type N-terminal cleavage/methylation domain-containing protein